MSALPGIERASELRVIECRGAPRDLGLDQGTACAAAIRERVGRAGQVGRLGRFRPADGDLAQARRAARDVRRHFPHLDECLIGLSRGARVPDLALAYLLARELGPDGEGGALSAGVAADGRIAVHGPAGGVLRRMTPDHGFASLDWTLPWLPGALAGTNRAGLAAAAVSHASDDASGCAAPAFLLVQNCLSQFETADAAAEWCERRPAGGHVHLIFADARGGRAAVVVQGEKRLRTPPAPLASDGGAASPVHLVLEPRAHGLELRDRGSSLRLQV